MYYQALRDISKYKKYEGETLKRLDAYLSNLNRSIRDRITTSSIATRLGVKHETASSLLDLCVRHDLLKRRFVIECPRCYGMVRIIEESQLDEVLQTGIYCDDCYGIEHETPLQISLENITVIYALIDIEQKKNSDENL